MSYQRLKSMVLRVCGELPTLKIIHGGGRVVWCGVGWGGVGWSGVVVGWGEVGWRGGGRGGVSYQRLTWMVLRLIAELPTLKIHSVKGLW